MIRRETQGFTLVELLVALLIFGMLSAAGVGLLSFSVRAQAASEERLADVAAIRRLGALMTSDLAQAATRTSRDEAGAVHPAFDGGPASIAFIRRGWENYDAAPRPSLQKVEYTLTAGRLERRAWLHLDGANAGAPSAMLDGVTALVLRYRDEEGAWRERWDPGDRTRLPKAVELAVSLKDGGTVRQLFLVGPSR